MIASPIIDSGALKNSAIPKTALTPFFLQNYYEIRESLGFKNVSLAVSVFSCVFLFF